MIAESTKTITLSPPSSHIHQSSCTSSLSYPRSEYMNVIHLVPHGFDEINTSTAHSHRLKIRGVGICIDITSSTRNPPSVPHILSYIILVVDIGPSMQKHLHYRGMPIPRGVEKGRRPPLHHIHRDSEIYSSSYLFTHTKRIYDKW